MKSILLLLLLILIGCTPSKPNSIWDKSTTQELDGVVFIATSWGLSHLCTGVVVRPDMVLTAGHCSTFPAEDLYIVWGCTNINDLSCHRVKVKKSHIQPEWKKVRASADDLAVLIPNVPINVEPIEIYTGDTPPQTIIKTIGGGLRNKKSGLLYTGYGTVQTNYQYEFIAYMGELDPKPGDSGGPALYWDLTEFKLVGILRSARLSKSYEDDSFEYKGEAIYVKPFAYLDWIYEVIGL